MEKVICEKCNSEMKFDHDYSAATEEQKQTLAPYEHCDCTIYVYKCSCGEIEEVHPPEEYQCETCRHQAQYYI
ncbi:hypothetical protein [Bacillus mobilis]|uniref:hypothetical protein n=1 Tax=Bacillus mobilis TaxID=2026190 RepID=UPI00330B0C25|nr:hypothetical protein [Bacillus mobilis]